MILRELIESVKIEDVKKALETLYKQDENQKDAYDELFETLQLVPIVLSKNHMTLHVEFLNNFGSNEWSATYSLYRRYKQKYSLEFATIEEIANASVLVAEIEKKEDYIAHILWEKLYNHDSVEDELKIQAQEKVRRQKNKTEYCSVQEILESIDEEVFDE